MLTEGHLAIAGAGIIGLAAALELRSAGYRVTVLEQGRAMGESSSAAAGMLAVEDPENSAALLPLARLSRALYPAFLARVEQLSGLRVPLRTTRTLQGHRTQRPGPPPGALPELCTQRYTFRELEEASLDPRDLCAALPLAARAAGVQLREHCRVSTLESAAGQVKVKLESGEVIEADHFVLATGAWAGPGSPAAITLPETPWLPIVPRKGQMIEVYLSTPELREVIRTPELYLVPRGEGRIVIGATVEDVGFDRSLEEAAGNRLFDAASELWPPLCNARLIAQWSGLRPGLSQDLRDSLPIIGPLGTRITVATGHFRNGILLAPGTARLLAECIAGSSRSVELEGFSPQRFSIPTR